MLLTSSALRLQSIRDIMDQVEASLNSIATSSMSALETLNSTPMELRVICPRVDQMQMESELGVDLTEIVGSVADQYDRLREELMTQLELGNAIVEKVESGLASLESSVATSVEYMWVIPGLLLAISFLAMTSILAVVLAWKNKSGIRFQIFMSWVVLPFLIIVATSCWVVVLMASLSSMVGTGKCSARLSYCSNVSFTFAHKSTKFHHKDFCTASSADGSPDQTVQEILSLHQLGYNDTIYQLTSAYTNQCKGPDPTQTLHDLEEDVQEHLDTIWRQMSKIDSIGRAQLIDKCGDGDAFTAMLTGARNLAKLLTAIRRSLSSMSRSLQCDHINPIYVVAAHETLCTKTLDASAYGFVMFLITAICSMVMITLRASWLRHIQEEKVYHDEDEVAENMILDEHEEYLAYISRYKHEWQEYDGIKNNASMNSDADYHDEVPNDESVFSNDERAGNNCSYDGSEERSDLSEIKLHRSVAGINITVSL
jgi:hypothetical protein